MEISQKIYTWLKQENFLSGIYEETPETITLSAEDSEKLELGLIFPLLKSFYKGSYPTVLEFKQVNSTVSRLYNWNLLIKPLESFGVKVTSDTKALIVAGDRVQVIEIITALQKALEKLRNHKGPKVTSDGGLILTRINPNSDIRVSESMLEFLVLSFCKAFSINAKISAGLLAQKCNYLQQVIIKGLKKDFKPVEDWYDMIENQKALAISLVQKEVSSLKLLLISLVPGLQSKSLKVQSKSAEILSFFHSHLKSLKVTNWDWLYGNSNIISDCFQIIQTTPELISCILNLLYSFGKKKLNEIFIIKLKEYCKGEYNYAKYFGLLVKDIASSGQSQYFCSNKIIDSWVEVIFNQLELDINSKSLNIKVFYIELLNEIWSDFPNYIENNLETPAKILSYIKKTIREGTLLIKIFLFGRLFSLLSILSNLKSQSAPAIYKAIAFSVIEYYNDELLREFILCNTIQIINEIQSIPIQIILEPLAKQTLIAKKLNMSVFDFDFYLAVSKQPGLSIKDAILVIDICGKVLLTDNIYYKSAEIPFLIITGNFIESPLLQEYIVKFIALALKFCVSLNPKKSLKNLYEALIEKIIRFGHEELNRLITQVFLNNYSDIKRLKDKSLKKIYRMLNDPMKLYDYSPRPKENKDEIFVSSLNSIPSIRVAMELERIKLKRLERENKERLINEQKSLNELIQKKNLKHQIAKRKLELGVKNRVQDDVDVIFDNIENDHKIELCWIGEEIEYDKKLIEIVLKKYKRVNRILFQKYAGSDKNKIASSVTFDDLQKQKKYITESDFSKMLRDNGILSLISLEEMKYIYSSYVKKLKNTYIKSKNLGELFYIIASIVFTREPRDLNKFPSAIYLESLYRTIKDCSELIPRSFFEEPDPGNGDKDVVYTLNQKLKQNPDIVIPDNYKKVEEDVIEIEYKVVYSKRRYRIVLEIIDDVFIKALGIHFLMPIVYTKNIVRAKGLGIENNRSGPIKYSPKIESNFEFFKLSPNIKLHALTINNFSNDITVECAKLIEDLIYTLEKNSPVLISKFPRLGTVISNRFVQEKKLKEIQESYFNQRKEKKRLERIKKVQEEASRLKMEKEYKEYLEQIDTKKKKLIAKIQEKKLKEKKDRERFEVEEKILEYKLNKLQSDTKTKDPPLTGRNLWKINNYENKAAVSLDLSRPKSFEKISSRIPRNKKKAVSTPRIPENEHKNY
jgi:hypothetical protein